MPERLRYARAMKTHRIEVQRILQMTEGHGLVHARIDATVQPQPPRDDGEPASVLTMTVENARVLYLLLKQQLAQVDGRKARSQR